VETIEARVFFIHKNDTRMYTCRDNKTQYTKQVTSIRFQLSDSESDSEPDSEPGKTG